jgi:hypothetical protein
MKRNPSPALCRGLVSLLRNAVLTLANLPLSWVRMIHLTPRPPTTDLGPSDAKIATEFAVLWK